MVTDEMRRDLATRLRDIGDDDGMAEAWRLRNAVSGSGLCDNAMADVALMADLLDRPTCENIAKDGFKCSRCRNEWFTGHNFGPLKFKYCPDCGSVVVK